MNWRGVGFKVHAIAKKGLCSNSSAMKIMQELDHDKTASKEWLFDHQRKPQNLANCIRLCGKLGDKHVQWFIDRRRPQNIAG